MNYATDPDFKNLCLFYEYFHGETGRGCGARYYNKPDDSCFHKENKCI